MPNLFVYESPTKPIVMVKINSESEEGRLAVFPSSDFSELGKQSLRVKVEISEEVFQILMREFYKNLPDHPEFKERVKSILQIGPLIPLPAIPLK